MQNPYCGCKLTRVRVALQLHNELLLARTKQRLLELRGSEEPQEIRLQLEMTDGFSEFVHEERMHLKTRLIVRAPHNPLRYHTDFEGSGFFCFYF